jgi:hypothetical protein
MRAVTGALGLTAWAFAASLSWAADAGPGGGPASDSNANVERFLMEGTEIQGTLEKPHVVYVVPWKDTSSVEGDIPLRRSFQQELLEPVDRARFQRQFSQGSSNATGGGRK